MALAPVVWSMDVLSGKELFIAIYAPGNRGNPAIVSE
jgi:hypothetical protein